ncbi:MAG: S24 family peptidase [Candidatus Paceibacterota bacterium]|jgi:SOS-response transcriptional repressor LexA
MHPTQQKILNLASSVKLNKKNSRLIARIIDIKNPQNVVHHIEQLEAKDFISIAENGDIKVEKQNPIIGQLFQLPICGSANAGAAVDFAEEHVEGYLAVPSDEIGRMSKAGLFLVEVDGDSLNNAKGLKGGPAETGDYAIVDGNNRSPIDGDYVLSIIDGLANLKRFYIDKENKRIILKSESTMETKPIYIKQDHLKDYMINGVIIGIIKK